MATFSEKATSYPGISAIFCILSYWNWFQDPSASSPATIRAILKGSAVGSGGGGSVGGATASVAGAAGCTGAWLGSAGTGVAAGAHPAAKTARTKHVARRELQTRLSYDILVLLHRDQAVCPRVSDEISLEMGRGSITSSLD